jgi:hypothetical protein
MAGTVSGQSREHGLVPGEVDGPEPARLRQGDQGTPDAGVRGVLHDPVAGLQVGVLAEDQAGRGRVAAKHRELLDAPLRQREQPLGGQQQPLAPGPGEQRHDHQVSHRDHAGILACLHDPGDALVAEYQRERRPQERATGEQQVVLVQRRELDGDLDLAGSGRGRLLEFDDAHDVLRPSELGDLDGTHAGSR